MSIINSLIISYNDIFDGLEVQKEELLSNYNRDLLMLSGTTLVNMSKPKSPYHNYKVLLSKWFSKPNENILNEICSIINKKESEYGNVSLLNMTSSLQLIDFAIKRGIVNSVENVDKSSIEIPLLKFYLILNKENIKDEIVSKSTEDLDGEDRLFALLLSQSLAYNDITNYELNEVIIPQFVKSMFLLDFMHENIKYRKIYEIFLSQFDITNWKEYITYYSPLIFSSIRSHNKYEYTDHIVEKNENYEKSCKFLDKHILNIDEEIPNSDFRYLRSKPFYKVEEGLYRSIYDLFVTEKIYNGLHFVLSGINNSLPKEDRIDIKGELGGNFSENYLFYSIIERITQKKYKEFRGQYLKDKYGNDLPSEPDYYLRNGKNLFLFESKDVLLKADVKVSFDYKIIKDELAKKFYRDGSDKAILQLLRNIKRILKLEFPFDKNYKPNNINIYPIIITHHRMFDTGGLNYLINNWFLEELEKLSKENFNVKNIRPITIINIDTLIIYNDLLKFKKLSLSDLIDKYIALRKPNTKKIYKNEEEIHQIVLKKYLPFSMFVNEFVKKNKLKPTFTLFREKGIELFS